MRYFKKQITTLLSNNAVLNCYIQNNEECTKHRLGPAIVICPGGGYEMIADREGEPIAIKMMSLGFQAFVLEYSLTPTHFPVSLLELCSAVRYVRQNAVNFNIDSNSIFVAGFSAGGHLAASLGVYWNKDLIEKYNYEHEDIRPNALLLGYPVITSGEYAHIPSIENLIGKQHIQDTELLKQVSVDLLVDHETPPCFIWHTETDDVVPVENSLMFATALRKNKVNFELLIYPCGGHGLSLETKETAHLSGNDIVPCVSKWPDRFVDFAKHIGGNFLRDE